jgi:ergothioneine biosynthesis protein EgtB
LRSALAIHRDVAEPGSGTLASEYLSVRKTTEKLCAPLTAEDQMVQSMPDASPAKWHQAHTTWFFETFILGPHMKGYRALDDRYKFFFNSYYKQLGGHPVRAQRGLWSRPSLEQVQQYRQYVDEQMIRVFGTETPGEIATLTVLGMNHEQQHQELIVTDIKHALWTNPLRPAYRDRKHVHLDSANSGHQKRAAPLRWIERDGGRYPVGHDGDGFAFDNETPRHPVLLQRFNFASRLTTNREYMEFMHDGGYSRPELWLSDGWDAVCANGWRAPLYWEQRDGEWRVYTLNGECPVDPTEPVCHVSFYEADAYARWAGARLLTEFEWEVAAADAPVNGNLLDSGTLHPQSSHENDHGAHQLFGDVWEWTATPYVAYPGFRPAAGVLGEYNGKFMCNQMVLRGGSCATPTSHIRATYRNFFPPHARWQFSGIRLAHD